MTKNCLKSANIPFSHPFNHTTAIEKSHFSTRFAPAVLLGLGLLGSHASHAVEVVVTPIQQAVVTPTQRAVINYFTDSSVCVRGTGGGDTSKAEVSHNVFLTEIPIDDGKPDKGEPIVNGYDCSNLRNANGETHFQSGIERLLNSPDSLDVDAALQALAFEEVITMGTLNVEINSAHMANLTAHVDDLHHGGLGMRHPSVSAKQLSDIKASGGGASANANKKIGFFFNSKVATGDKDVSTQETGFDYDAYGFTAGMDLRINNGLVVGFAAGYGNTKADYTSSTGSMEMDGYSLAAFATLFEKDKYYIDGIVNLTRNKFDSSRTFVTPNNVTQTAVGETDGNVLTVGLGMGYEDHIKDVTIGPFVRLNYTRVDIDGFSETGAGPVGLEVDDQELTSFEGIVGFQASKIISQSWGVLIPQMRVEFVHEFENESRIVNARFLGAVENGINTTLQLPTDRPDHNYFNLALATSAQFSHGRTAFIQYSGLFAQQDVSEHAVELGVRWSY